MVMTVRSRLSPRERDILLLAAAGKSIPQICRLLSLRLNTVKQTRAHAMRRLGADNMMHVLTKALLDGQVTVDELRAVERAARQCGPR